MIDDTTIAAAIARSARVSELARERELAADEAAGMAEDHLAWVAERAIRCPGAAFAARELPVATEAAVLARAEHQEAARVAGVLSTIAERRAAQAR